MDTGYTPPAGADGLNAGQRSEPRILVKEDDDAVTVYDLADAVRSKFDATSEKHGFPERLPQPLGDSMVGEEEGLDDGCEGGPQRHARPFRP